MHLGVQTLLLPENAQEVQLLAEKRRRPGFAISWSSPTRSTTRATPGPTRAWTMHSLPT